MLKKFKHWAMEHGRVPSAYSADPEEKKLGEWRKSLGESSKDVRNFVREFSRAKEVGGETYKDWVEKYSHLPA